MLLTPDHRNLADRTIGFIAEYINPNVDAWEEAGRMPLRLLFRKLGNAGLLGVSRSRSFGGQGLDLSYSLIAAEALGEANCGGVQMAIGVQSTFATSALAKFGSEDLKAEFLAPAIAGRMIACLAITEEEAGSDVSAIKMTAIRDGRNWVIEGEKTWVTNGIEGDFAIVLANTAGEQRNRSKSLFVVPLASPGIERSGPIAKLGMRSADTPTIRFQSVRIPERYLIGEVGRGFQQQMVGFDEERLWAAANVLRTLDRCIDATIAYTGARSAFGHVLLDRQAIQFRLAELRTEVAALRALTYATAERCMAGETVTALAAMAKLKAGRLLREVPDACLQFWGGAGYRWDNPVARLYRDGRLASIGGGADEIMLSIIARDLRPSS